MYAIVSLNTKLLIYRIILYSIIYCIISLHIMLYYNMIYYAINPTSTSRPRVWRFARKVSGNLQSSIFKPPHRSYFFYQQLFFFNLWVNTADPGFEDLLEKCLEIFNLQSSNHPIRVKKCLTELKDFKLMGAYGSSDPELNLFFVSPLAAPGRWHW